MQIALDRGGKLPWEVFEVRTAPKIATSRGQAADPAMRKGRKYLVGYVGVMGNADGVDYLVNAAASHREHKLGRRDVQFLLMGTGPEHAGLGSAQRDRLRLAGVRRFTRAGFQQRIPVLRFAEPSTLAWPATRSIPYNDHCTMNKTLEYMAFGKAQVMFGTKEGRASAGPSATYVEENSAEKLGEAIVRALESPEQLEEMGRLGAERLRSELNWERSVAQLLTAYGRALAS